MKAYLQVYGADGLKYAPSAGVPGEEAKRLAFNGQIPGFAGFDGDYLKLDKYEGGQQIQGAKWLPVEIEANLGPQSSVAIDFAFGEKRVVSKAGTPIMKAIQLSQGNKNPLNMAIAEVLDEHPEVSADGEFVSRLIFLAKVTSFGTMGTSSTVMAEYAWEDSALDDENIACIYGPNGAGPGVEIFPEFKAAWDSVFQK